MSVDFTIRLMKWHADTNRRQMPWKGETDPYKVWLSEIILQQTRVEQGWSYYERFITAFPTIHDLATAPEERVFKMWEGLGYYTRCKNLLDTARYIAFHLEGVFPDTYEEILQLKGIGPYTAAAIASFAFNRPVAVVDGNVLRVIARFFGISTNVGSSQGKKLFGSLAQSLLDKNTPALYNQAVMDFGATICKPKNPLCGICVQASECEAFRHGLTNTLPVKDKIIRVRTRWMYYFLIEVGDSVYIRKRAARDIWQNLHEFVLLEKDDAHTDPSGEFLEGLIRQSYVIRHASDFHTQQLTHQRINGRFYRIVLSKAEDFPGNYHLVKKSELSRYAFPKFINSFLEKGR